MSIEKIITFIYWDAAEKNMYQPIIEEAKKRGYLVELTENKLQKCEIGVYCQHVNYPQYSKLSVIMLHDIIQQYRNWPDIWYREPWDKYDIGILPSSQWEDNWNKCSQWTYTRPRKGIFKIGWPKADVILKLKENSSKEYFFKKFGMDISKRTVLYAPSWENDHKQDDFVQSMLKLDVNILIKQAHVVEKDYPQIVNNIKEMYRLHKDIPEVTILPPETNIFEAIAISDVLVSEESSTMCEAAMMGIPAVSVSNWLIPDTKPSRLPSCDYDFVIMTTKEELHNCIYNIISNYDNFHQRSIKFRDNTFSNVGNTSSMIMDIIDDCVSNTPIRYNALIPHKEEHIPFNKNIKRHLYLITREVSGNYAIRYRIVRWIWNCILKTNRIIKIHL